VELAQHGVVLDPYERQDFIIGNSDRLLIDLMTLSVPAVEPRIASPGF
jgi:hypothetical protein